MHMALATKSDARNILSKANLTGSQCYTIISILLRLRKEKHNS